MFLKQCWCTYAAYAIYRWLVNLRADPDRHRDDWLCIEPLSCGQVPLAGYLYSS